MCCKRHLGVRRREVWPKLTLVLGGGLHEVGTRTNVGRVGALGDELEVQGVAAGGDTVGAAVVGAVNAALRGASGARSAERGVPLVSRVAVGRAAHGVSPAPVGVKGDGTGHVGAGATSSALLPGEGRVRLGGEGAHLLGSGAGHEGSEGSELGIHCEESVGGTGFG